jgi:hypothetical protein
MRKFDYDLSNTKPMEFNENMNLVSRCPFCSAEYDLDGAQVVGEQEDATMVHVNCDKCESSTVAMVAMTGLGIVNLGLVTDMNLADTKQFFAEKNLSSNELLEIYEALHQDTKGVV